MARSTQIEDRPGTQITVTDAQWHALWTAVNTGKSDTLRIDRAALAAVYADMETKPPLDLIVQGLRQSAKTITVNRAPLFAFLGEASRAYGLLDEQKRKKESRK